MISFQSSGLAGRCTERVVWISYSAVATPRNYPYVSKASKAFFKSCSETMSKKGAGRSFEYFWWSGH